MSELNLSICVVLYRSEEISHRFHHELVTSLAGHTGWQLSYYDNSPTDALSQLVPHDADARMSYVHDARNLGFSFANNQLILAAAQPRILLLNPDVFGFESSTWDRIVQQDTSASVRFIRLLNADGSFQDCIGEVSSLGRAISPRRNYADIDTPTQVGMGIMAFMLADKSVYARVGLLDTDYPLYGEDMDWCYRANRSGQPVIYEPAIELTHIGGASAGDRWQRKGSLMRKYAAENIFIGKHYRGLRWAAMRALNAVKRLRVHLHRAQ